MVKRNVLNVDFHIANYTKIINQLREEVSNLRSQLSHGGVLSQPSVNSSPEKTNLKHAKIEMHLQFEKEVTLKKEICELDVKNEDIAFQLFSKQLALTKANNKGLNSPELDNQTRILKSMILVNAEEKRKLQRNLGDLEKQREQYMSTI